MTNATSSKTVVIITGEANKLLESCGECDSVLIVIRDGDVPYVTYQIVWDECNTPSVDIRQQGNVGGDHWIIVNCTDHRGVYHDTGYTVDELSAELLSDGYWWKAGFIIPGTPPFNILVVE